MHRMRNKNKANNNETTIMRPHDNETIMRPHDNNIISMYYL